MSIKYDPILGAVRESDLGTVTWNQIDKTVSDLADITTKNHSSLSGVGTTSHTELDSLYTTVQTTSGTWSGGSSISGDSVFTTVEASSGDWNNTTSTVEANSGMWGTGGSTSGLPDYEFTNSDLTDSILTLAGTSSINSIVDLSGYVVMPTEIQYKYDDIQTAVSLSGLTPIDGTWKVRYASAASEKLTENTTVNFDTSMTATQIQTLIDAQPKNFNGYTLTFQFADGTYTLDASLRFDGFWGGNGVINGNLSDNSLNTTKAVFLDFTGGSCHGIEIGSLAGFTTQSLKIAIDTSSTSYFGVYVNCGGNRVNVYNNYIYGNSATHGGSVYLNDHTYVQCVNNYVSNVLYGIRCVGGLLYSGNNDDTGTAPGYGLCAAYGGVIAKYSTPQPTGSISNELTTNAGLIR